MAAEMRPRGVPPVGRDMARLAGEVMDEAWLRGLQVAAAAALARFVDQEVAALDDYRQLLASFDPSRNQLLSQFEMTGIAQIHRIQSNFLTGF